MSSAKTQTEVEALVPLLQEPRETEVHGAPLLLSPPGWEYSDLSKFLPAPLRIKESPVFTGAEDFAKYFAEFKREGTRIFVDDTNFLFRTVFDCSTPDHPRHGDHSASLKMSISPEWDKWKKKNSGWMPAREFIAFIENNIDNLGDSEFPATKLLDMCRRIRVAIKGDVAVDEIDRDGIRSLVANATTRVAGQNAEGVDVPFPEFMATNLRIFKNAERYTFKVRLRWDCENGKVQFRFDLQNIDEVEEEAFNKVIASVEKLTGASVLRGAYSGSYHK